MVLARRNVALAQASQTVRYITEEDALAVAQTASQNARKGARDELLVLVLFQVGLRISEALGLRPMDKDRFEGRPTLTVIGKGRKLRTVACPDALADRLGSYAYERGLSPGERYFPITRVRGWQIVKEAAQRAGITKRVYPHLFRHGDAIYRLRATGDPKALQDHLGHSSVGMTMRYLSTIQAEESLRVQQDVEFGR